MPAVNRQHDRRKHGGTREASTAAGTVPTWRHVAESGLVVNLVGMTPEEFVAASRQALIDMGAVPVKEGER